jgi:hypothetical protein
LLKLAIEIVAYHGKGLSSVSSLGFIEECLLDSLLVRLVDTLLVGNIERDVLVLHF